MKKFMTLALTAVLALAVTACGSKIADGSYTAELDDASAAAAYGWRDTVVAQYKDGKLVSATFESYDADGNKKSETTAETYPMDPAPADWIPELTSRLTKAGEAKRVDAIAGATTASNNAKALLTAIEKSGKPGETIQVPAAGE